MGITVDSGLDSGRVFEAVPVALKKQAAKEKRKKECRGFRSGLFARVGPAVDNF